MSNFVISEFHATSKTLFRQEIDAILEVVDHTLREFKSAYPTKGTLIVDGQAKDQKAQCIVRLNLVEGAWRRRFFRIYERTSDSIAADSIDNALSWPEESRYRLTEEKALHFGWLPSGIYRDGELEVLILNTTHGRFLASFCAEFELSGGTCGETESVLVAIATAIGKMGIEDGTLQHSVKQIQHQVQGALFAAEVVEEVESLFEECTSPCLKIWREWHEPANQSGELKLFFE